MPEAIINVFLSSTARDLARYREAVAKAINGLDGYKCIRMEEFGARPKEPDAFCREKVAKCDLFVGIVGLCYGSVAPDGRSYTEQEYDAAVAKGIPRLMFIAPDDFALPGNLREPDEKWQAQQHFRQRVKKEQIPAPFTSPEDLARAVLQAIINWTREYRPEAISQSSAIYGPGSRLNVKVDFEASNWEIIMTMANALVMLDSKYDEVPELLQTIRSGIQYALYERSLDLYSRKWNKVEAAVEQIASISIPVQRWGTAYLLMQIRSQINRIFDRAAGELRKRGDEEKAKLLDVGRAKLLFSE